MASDEGNVATSTPPSSRHLQASTAGNALVPEETARLLKRQRESTPPSPNSFTTQQLHLLQSPAKSARLALAAGHSPPPPLTGAAALEDDRRRREAEQTASPAPSSDNPSHRVLESLMQGDAQAMSRPSDAPPTAPPTAPTASMDSRSAAPSLSIIPGVGDQAEQQQDDMSPQSAHNSIAGAGVTASPTPMDVDGKLDGGDAHHVAGDERPQPGSLSYPGSLQASGSMTEASPRGMTFPTPGQEQTSPSLPGSRKHRCPYCSTEFTRHHNLKSHLLTHSQEKPFVCTECPLRFRRLHDLKRHGKLHTGEKPHTCPKCDRKFARGDALARHTKGAGGCAGRRTSMGSFADGDDFEGHTLDADESVMSGLAYDHPDDEELRRQSMPTVTTQQPSVSETDGHGAHARTYPPAMSRPSGSGLYPPNAAQAQVQGNSAGSTSVPNSMAGSHTPNTSVSSAPVAGNSAGLYSQAGMTESPKPLSPGISGHEPSSAPRQRSPGLSQQQSQANRRQTDLQSPHGQAKYPGLSHPGYATANSASFSNSGNQTQDNSKNMFAQADPNVWAYIQTMDDKIKGLNERVATLEHELAMTKAQRDNGGGDVALSS